MPNLSRSILLLISLTLLFSCESAQMHERQSGEVQLKVESQRQDLFSISVNDKVGFIDKTGRTVIEPQFYGAHEFAEGRAAVAVSNKEYKEGYIDERGKFLTVPQFDKATDFSEGLAAVGFGKFGIHGEGEHRWGFIDRTGKIVIEPQFKETLGFSEDLAAVMNVDWKWGYIDKTGNIVIPFQFNDAISFSEELACVMIDDYFGFIDKSGKVIIKPNYSTPNQFKEGLASVTIGDKKTKPYKFYGTYIVPADHKRIFIDKSGKTVITLPESIVKAADFSEGLAMVTTEKDGTGYIDKTGKFVIEPKFLGFATNFSEGLAIVEHKDKISFIDKIGKIIIKTDYSYARNFQNGLAWVEKGKVVGEFGERENAEYGYIDKTGKVIWQSKK